MFDTKNLQVMTDVFGATDSLLLLPHPQASLFDLCAMPVVLWVSSSTAPLVSLSSPTKPNGAWGRGLSLAVEFREQVKTTKQQHSHLQTLSLDIVCKR